jgi:hypothetical protein
MGQKIALILIGIGIVALIGWGVQSFFMASDIPVTLKIAVAAIGLGILVLIGIAVKERRIKAKTDKFKEVER